MAANSECWLLTRDEAPLAQCQPGESIGGIHAEHLPELTHSLLLDCMGGFWFASRTAGDDQSAILNGEPLDAGAPCVLNEGDNPLRMGGDAFILRITSASESREEVRALAREPAAAVSAGKRFRALEIVRDPVFRAGRLAEAMAKATFEAVDILSADRASLWLYGERPGVSERILEMRANFKEDGFTGASNRSGLMPEGEVPAPLRGITAQFLGAKVIERGDADLGPLHSSKMICGALVSVMVIAVGGGPDENLGYLVVERLKEDGEPWVEGDLLAAQCLASLVLQALEAQDRRQIIEKLGETKAFLAAELSAASNYVRKVLPAPISDGPIRAEWQFIPSSQLGGDSFSYEWVSSRFFVCYVLDVVGHGTGASLLAISVMNSVRALLLRDAANPPPPAAVLSHLNASFPMEQQSDLTFSMWFGVFDQETRSLSYSAGGHPPALLIVPDGTAPGGSRVVELGVEGVALGSWPDYSYEESAEVIPPQAKLFLCSDGAFEIPIEGGGQWSFEEFTALLGTAARMAGGETDYLRKKIGSILDASSFPDDFSILCLSFDDKSE